MNSGLQLRMLVRNAEARVEHLTAWFNSLQPGDFRPRDLQEQIDYANAQLVKHSVALSQLSPAAPFLVNVAPSCDAVQSASLS